MAMDMKSEGPSDAALDGTVGILSDLGQWLDAAFEGGSAAVGVVLEWGEGGIVVGEGEGPGGKVLVGEGSGGLGEGGS